MLSPSTLSLLPRQLAIPYSNTERYGLIVVVVLLVTGVLTFLMRPLFNASLSAIGALTGVDMRTGL